MGEEQDRGLGTAICLNFVELVDSLCFVPI